MKHCPQCSFLYLDSDLLCDLDQTPLIGDDSGTEAGVFERPPVAGELLLTAAVQQRKLNLKTLLTATVTGLILGLMLLLSYQRLHATLQISQAPPPSHPQASPDYVASQVAQVSDEASAKAALALPESDPSAPPGDTSPSAKSISTAKTTPNTRPDPARLRLSSNPVSTGDITKPPGGLVTIRLANGSSLQADEVWRTKAGMWYRRKGIVTLLRSNRVRATNN